MKITIPALGEIEIEVDADDIKGAIDERIQENLSWQMKNIVDEVAREWIKELMAAKKEEIIARLRPELDKKMEGISLSRNTY